MCFAVSCQQEQLDAVSDSVITYKVQVPQQIQVRAAAEDAVTELVYEVWRTDKDDDTILDTSDQLLYDGTVAMTGGQAEVEVKHIQNQSLTILFWAQAPNNTVYNTESLTNVILKKTSVSDPSHYLAFSGVSTIKKNSDSAPRSIELKRPVAQLNLATVQGSLSGLTLSNVSAQVTGLSDSYNVAEQAPGQIMTSSLEYMTAHPSDLGTITVDAAVYDCISVNYIGFIPADGTNVDMAYTIVTSEGQIENTVSNIPVKPNYRTNIIGNLIASGTSYSVSIDNVWDAYEDGKIKALYQGQWKEYTSLGSAISSADDASTILLGMSTTLPENTIINKNLTISSREGSGVILTGRLYITGKCDVTLKDLTFKWNGYATNPIEIRTLDSESTLTFSNCTFDSGSQSFTNNWSYIHFYDNYKGVLKLSGCVFDSGDECALGGKISGNAAVISQITSNDFSTRGISLSGPKNFTNLQIHSNKIGTPFQITASDNSYSLLNIWIENNTLTSAVTGLNPEANYTEVYYRGNNIELQDDLKNKIITQ